LLDTAESTKPCGHSVECIFLDPDGDSDCYLE
jgi:hypothetical protein